MLQDSDDSNSTKLMRVFCCLAFVICMAALKPGTFATSFAWQPLQTPRSSHETHPDLQIYMVRVPEGCVWMQELISLLVPLGQ